MSATPFCLDFSWNSTICTSYLMRQLASQLHLKSIQLATANYIRYTSLASQLSCYFGSLSNLYFILARHTLVLTPISYFSFTLTVSHLAVTGYWLGHLPSIIALPLLHNIQLATNPHNTYQSYRQIGKKVGSKKIRRKKEVKKKMLEVKKVGNKKTLEVEKNLQKQKNIDCRSKTVLMENVTFQSHRIYQCVPKLVSILTNTH